MACGSCGTGGGCSTGCGKLDVHDWLGNMNRPASMFDAVEIRFKGGRKEFYRNVNNLELYTGDIIVVENNPGFHLGEVTMQGEMVRLQLKKKKVTYSDDLPIIYRKATEKDVEKFEQSRVRELPTMYRTRELIREYNLNMKLSDVEFQADNTKATFFYSAEDRVDFRELIKVLAGEFKIRIEMKQISLRQEAGRLGGIGSCGQELCCSTWLTDFKNVNTSAARYQNLSLNPTKLSGQCGRLKCCLNYELDTYMQAVKEIPDVKGPIKTSEGLYFLQKTDIFKRIMYFSLPNDNDWIPLEVERVHEILEYTKQGLQVHTLHFNVMEEVDEDEVINSDLSELDARLKKKNQAKNKPNTNRQNAAPQKGNVKFEKKRPEENRQQRPAELPKNNPGNSKFSQRTNINPNENKKVESEDKRVELKKETPPSAPKASVPNVNTETPKVNKPDEAPKKEPGTEKIWKRQNVKPDNNS